jgi:hypothetical protein
VKIDRRLPVRVSLVVLNIALFVFTMVAIGKLDIPASEAVEALMWCSGVIGAAIAGDSWRPSGHLRGELPGE